MIATFPLDDLLGTPALTKVLRVLTTSPNTPLSGRELARRSGVAPSQAVSALKTLETKGVVWRRVVGRSDQWSLDQNAVLAQILATLFVAERSIRSDLLEGLRRALKQLPVKEASIFGSVARGDANEASDLDVFIRVRSTKDAERVNSGLLDFRLAVLKKYGVDLSPLVLTDEEVRRPLNPKLIESLQRDRIPLVSS